MLQIMSVSSKLHTIFHVDRQELNPIFSQAPPCLISDSHQSPSSGSLVCNRDQYPFYLMFGVHLVIPGTLEVLSAALSGIRENVSSLSLEDMIDITYLNRSQVWLWAGVSQGIYKNMSIPRLHLRETQSGLQSRVELLKAPQVMWLWPTWHQHLEVT